MKVNSKRILIFMVIIIVSVSLFTWYKFKSYEIMEEGEIILEGYLVTNCPWSAYPWLEDVKSLFGSRCYLDIWLSENKPLGRETPNICRGHLPITSSCFLEKIGFDIPNWSEYPRVTLIGRYENMKVCYLGSKHPPEWECKEEKVLVPRKIIKK